jgi:hypothetical protein
VIVSEGEKHMVLDQFPQTSSMAMQRNVHDGGHKFIDGRHGTFFFGEHVGELLPAFFLVFSVV